MLDRTSAEPDWYGILGVETTASVKEIKTARNRQADEYHPDKLQQIPPAIRTLAEAKLKDILEAYSVLSDVNQRHAYDERRKARQQEKDDEYTHKRLLDIKGMWDSGRVDEALDSAASLFEDRPGDAGVRNVYAELLQETSAAHLARGRLSDATRILKKALEVAADPTLKAKIRGDLEVLAAQSASAKVGGDKTASRVSPGPVSSSGGTASPPPPPVPPTASMPPGSSASPPSSSPFGSGPPSTSTRKRNSLVTSAAFGLASVILILALVVWLNSVAPIRTNQLKHTYDEAVAVANGSPMERVVPPPPPPSPPPPIHTRLSWRDAAPTTPLEISSRSVWIGFGEMHKSFFSKTPTWKPSVIVAGPLNVRAYGRLQLSSSGVSKNWTPAGTSDEAYYDTYGDVTRSPIFRGDRRKNHKLLPTAPYLALLGRTCGSPRQCSEPFLIGTGTTLCPARTGSGELQFIINDFFYTGTEEFSGRDYLEARGDALSGTYYIDTVPGPASACQPGTYTQVQDEVLGVAEGRVINTASNSVSSRQHSWRPLGLRVTAPLRIRAAGEMQDRTQSPNIAGPDGIPFPAEYIKGKTVGYDFGLGTIRTTFIPLISAIPYQSFIGRLCSGNSCSVPFKIGTDAIICPDPAYPQGELSVWFNGLWKERNHYVDASGNSIPGKPIIGMLAESHPSERDVKIDEVFGLRLGEYVFEIARANDNACNRTRRQ